MAITTTALGSYTTQINLTGELNSTAMIAALDAAIVAGGWAQFDVYAGGTQRVYRALNKDAVTYKYVSFFIDIATLKISTTCFESWNATTHVGTNEVYTSFRLGACGYNLASSDIVLMISSRWCLIQSFIKGQPSQWSGVFEIMREAAEDTAAAGYPCFAWACSTTFPALAFPRTRAGLVGSSAVVTGMQTPYGRITTSTQFNTYVPYAYDVTKRIIQSMRPALSATEIHGRVYGLKGVYDVGSPYSRVSIPIDTEFNYLSTGTSSEHWVLGDTPGPTNVSNFFGLPGAANAFANVSSNSISTTTSSAYATAVANLGGAYYCAMQYSGGIAKFDAGPGLVLLSPSIAAFGTTVATDLCSDGRYLYASTVAGISRIDPQNNDSVTTLALTNGAASLFFDGTFVWAGAVGQRASNTIYKVDPSTFTLVSTVTLGNAAAAVIGGMTSDLNGNLYAPTFAQGSSAVAIYKIVISTGSNSVFATGTQTGIYLASLLFDGAFIHLGHQVGGVSVALQAWNLAGAIAISPTISVGPANFATVIGLYKASIARIGGFILVGAGENASGGYNNSYMFNISGAAGSGVSATPLQSNLLQICPGALFCDGNKVVYVQSNAGTTVQTLTVITNINHPDDGASLGVATLRGRMLLPK